MTRRARRNPRVSGAIEALEPRRLLSVDPVPRPVFNTGTGFFVSGGKVYDANGYEFVIRGVNQNQWWGNPAENLLAIDEVAKTGANAVRAVMNWVSGGSDTPTERRTIVERYLANNIVPIVEDHAATNSNDNESPAALATIVDKWLDPANLSWLQQYEQKLILNIANEWGPNSTVWRDTYIQQVQRLRNAGVNALIMIDAGGWGQEINTIKSWASAILNADPQKNVVFSIHFYSQWRTEERSFDVGGGTYDVLTELNNVRNQGLPIVVGEFSWEGVDSVAYRAQRVMEICQQLGVGYMGWAWNYNNPSTLDMIPGTAYQYNSNVNLSPWGDIIVNHPDAGIKATSVRATVFPQAAPMLVLKKTTVNVAEGGAGVAQVRLSSPPTSNVVVSLAKVFGGDASLSLSGGGNVTFTPSNWNQYQPILLTAAPDADSTIGSARFTLSAPGLRTTDFTAKETEANLPLGGFTLNPTDDRDTQSDNAAGTNATVSASKWNHFYMKFDLGGIGGKASSATLRVYKSGATASNITGRVWHAVIDGWTQSVTPLTTSLSYPVASRLLPGGVGYVDFDVSGLIASELNHDRVVTLAITTSSDNWTSFQTREGANKPQLLVTATEAVPPALLTSQFDAATSVHALVFGFSENVGVSLAPTDLVVENLTTPAAVPAVAGVTYNPVGNAARFSFSPSILPDGRYRATLPSAGIADAAGNPLLIDHAFEFFFIQGDANGDASVNIGDFSILAANFNTAGGYADGDFNYNGLVEIGDFSLLASKFNQSLEPIASAARAGGSAPAEAALSSSDPMTVQRRQSLWSQLNV